MFEQNPKVRSAAELAVEFHTAVPSALFRSYLGSIASVYSLGELMAITTMGVGNRSLDNMAGVEYATNLTTLNAYTNQLTTLDVANLTNLTSLNAYTNQLTTLDVANLTNLTILHVNSNQLTALDVANLVNLTHLYAGGNQLTALDVANLTNLTTLHVYTNQLTALDVANLTNLTSLRAYSNQLTALDVANLTNLTLLYASSNQFAQIALETIVDDLWANRVVLGGNSCGIQLDNNPGSAATAVSKASQITDLVTAGCTVVI